MVIDFVVTIFSCYLFLSFIVHRTLGDSDMNLASSHDQQEVFVNTPEVIQIQKTVRSTIQVMQANS